MKLSKMMLIKIAIAIAIILQNQEISGFLVGGSNLDICDSAMLLSGLINVINNQFPIEIEVPDKVVSGDVLNIKIKNLSDVNVSGFAIQARSTDEYATIGNFSPNIDVNTINCHGIFNSAAIYRNSPSKNELIIEWQSPIIEESIEFKFL